MNKPILVSVYGLLIISLLQLNCSKKDSVTLSTTDKITLSAWKFDKATANGTDISAQIPTCFKDNTITFASNGSGTINEGTTVCVPPAPASFTWSFQNNGSQLNLSTALITGGSGIFNLVTLNEMNLVISQDMIIPPATTSITGVITFKH